MNKEKDNPQQQMRDLFSQMVSQTSGMFSPMDPLGAMKPLQQVAEAWTKKIPSSLPTQCRTGLNRSVI